VIHAGREGLEVACAGGSIIVEELQLEGKKRLPARDFLAGYKIVPGTILGDRP
jgi:methionyl-tRNA formyltransferase